MSLRRAARPAVAGLAAAACWPPVPRRPALAAPAALHVTGTVSLGAVTSKFTYQFSEAPNGTVYYVKGGVVDAVAGPRSRPRCCMLARLSSPSRRPTADFFVQIGRLIIEFKVSNTHRVRSWTLPKSPAALTSAGLYAVGSTLWSWTDWATDRAASSSRT